MIDDTVYNICKRHVFPGKHITNGKRYKERLQLTSEDLIISSTRI